MELQVNESQLKRNTDKGSHAMFTFNQNVAILLFRVSSEVTFRKKFRTWKLPENLKKKEKFRLKTIMWFLPGWKFLSIRFVVFRCYVPALLRPILLHVWVRMVWSRDRRKYNHQAGRQLSHVLQRDKLCGRRPVKK